MSARRSFIGALVLVLASTTWCRGQDAPAVQSAIGVVDKVEKEAIVVKPRDASGRFLPALTLKVTGTSKIATLGTQTRAGKTVLTQKDTESKDLAPKQAIAVLYAVVGKDAVLLSAVVQPAK